MLSDLIDLGNGLVSIRCQTTAWINAELLPMGPHAKFRDNRLWNYHHSPDIFKCIFLNENVRISTNISLNFFPWGPFDCNRAVVQIMAGRWPSDKELSEPMMVGLPMQICITRLQWVKTEKDNELASPRQFFLKQIGISNAQSTNIARTLRQGPHTPTPACPLKGKQWTAGGGVIPFTPPEAG